MSISDRSPFEHALRLTGLSQADFAKRLNVSQASISRWCAGHRRPPDPAFAELAAILASPQLRDEHDRWLTSCRRQPSAGVVVEVDLPEGLDAETARRVCLAALSQARTGGGAR